VERSHHAELAARAPAVTDLDRRTAMKYLMMIKHSEDYRGKTPPQGLMDAMGEFVQASLANGTLLETAGLRATKDGARVRLSGGKLTVTDGPFTEAKEIVGGFAIIEAKTRQQAMELATKFMELHRVHWPEFDGECEVRPYEDMG
jgi:hypothetical protein